MRCRRWSCCVFGLVVCLIALRVQAQTAGSAQAQPTKKQKTNSSEKSVGVLIGFERISESAASDEWSEGKTTAQGSRRRASDGAIIGRLNDSEQESPFETVWFSSSGEDWSVRQVQDIVVPRNDGFWRVGKNTSRIRMQLLENITSNTADFLWITPVGKDPQFESLRAAICRKEKAITRLDYVSPLYLASTTYGYSDCGHISEEHYASVNPLDSRYDPVQIRALLGPEADEAFLDVAAELGGPVTFHDSAETCESPGYEGSENAWTLRHERGSWKAYAIFVALGDGSCSRHSVTREIHAPLSPKNFGTNGLPLPWNEIESRFPNAADAFASPNAKWIVVLSKDELTLVEVRKDKIGKTLATAKIPRGRAVMAEWAYGRHVGDWDRQFAALPAPSTKVVFGEDVPD